MKYLDMVAWKIFYMYAVQYWHDDNRGDIREVVKLFLEARSSLGKHPGAMLRIVGVE